MYSFYFCFYFNFSYEPRALAWSDDEVIEHWITLFKASLLIDRMKKGEQLVTAEKLLVTEFVQEWCSRLTDLGWFSEHKDQPEGITFAFPDYLELVDRPDGP